MARDCRRRRATHAVSAGPQLSAYIATPTSDASLKGIDCTCACGVTPAGHEQGRAGQDQREVPDPPARVSPAGTVSQLLPPHFATSVHAHVLRTALHPSSRQAPTPQVQALPANNEAFWRCHVPGTVKTCRALPGRSGSGQWSEAHGMYGSLHPHSSFYRPLQASELSSAWTP